MSQEQWQLGKLEVRSSVGGQKLRPFVCGECPNELVLARFGANYPSLSS